MGRWVFLGYIGAGNVGDDLMAERFLEQLDPAVLPDTVVLGRSETRPKFLDGIPVRYARASAKASLRHVLGAEGLVVLGGTNLHDAVSDGEWRLFRRKLVALTAVMGLCRLFGGKVVHLGVGVGPLRRPDARRIAAAALKLGSLVVLRDRNSFELCRALGVRQPHEACDLAFLDLLAAPSSPGPADDGRRILGIAPTTLANLPGVPADIDSRFWDAMCDRIAERAAAGTIETVRIFAFNVSGGLSDDRTLCQDILSRLAKRGVAGELVAYQETPAAILRSMRDCAVFMAFRYHSAIMAALLGRRLILVPYHRKVLDLVEQLGLDADDVLTVSSAAALEDGIASLTNRLDAASRPAMDRRAIIDRMRHALDLAVEVGIPLRNDHMAAPALEAATGSRQSTSAIAMTDHPFVLEKAPPAHCPKA
jgi:polysaccharide pyruvyl transferase WcaK-like protein